MKVNNMLRKLIKAYKIILYRAGIFEMIRYGVAASVEHFNVLSVLNFHTVIDIGANRGQFSLISRKCFPKAQIHLFEPLSKLTDQLKVMFRKDNNIYIHCRAIGRAEGESIFHVSQQDDSSSLLPIGKAQIALFPGTDEREQQMIKISPLDSVLHAKDIVPPALLKLDVQGFELEALRGCESLIKQFQYVYCECSFVELYEEQALADEVIHFLHSHNFKITGVYNVFYDKKGASIQTDILFKAKKTT